MSSLVMIKSYTNGLKVYLDKDCSFNDLYNALSEKFTQSAAFFNNASVVISFEGRELSALEEKQLVNCMEDTTGMKVLYVIGKDESTDTSFARAYDRPLKSTDDLGYFGRMYYGNVRKGEKLQTESGVVIMGDIEPGATVIAGGSIIVLGTLAGTAVCEVDENKVSAFILAMDFVPEKVRISESRYVPKEKGKWLIKPKMQAKIAFYKESEIIVEPVSAELIKSISESVKR